MRDLLVLTMALLIFFLAVLGHVAAQSPSSVNGSLNLAEAQVLENPFPYDFPNMDAPPVALFPMPSCKGVTLEEATIDQLQDAMSRGNLTSTDILNCYLDRISQTNSYIKYANLIATLFDEVS